LLLDSDFTVLPETSIPVGSVQDEYTPHIPSTEHLIHSNNGQTELQDMYEEDFATAFAKLLYERPEVKPWAVFALDGLSISDIDQRLSPILKDYSIELWKLSNGRSSIVSSFAVTLRRSRHIVARHFGIICGIQDGVSHSRIGEERLPLVSSKDIQDFLLPGRSFQRLLHDMRKAFYFDDTAQLRDVEALVLNGVPFYWPRLPYDLKNTESMQTSPDAVLTYPAAIKLHWNLKNFLQGEFEANEAIDLGSVITLTGSACYAQATTCERYMTKNWPSTSHDVLQLLRVALLCGKASCTFFLSFRFVSFSIVYCVAVFDYVKLLKCIFCTYRS
jgi:hypothetical protein